MTDLNAEPLALGVMRGVIPQEHQAALDIVAAIYGDSTDAVINGLMDMAVRTAILAGVSGDRFARGIKEHWDFYAAEINRMEM